MRCIVPCLLAFVLFQTSASLAQEADNKFTMPHITVSASSTIKIKPDIAYLELGVVTEKPTANEALGENSKAAAGALATLKELGVDPKDIKTDKLSLDPIFLSEPNLRRISGRVQPAPTLVGYRATNLIEVTFRDVDHAGSVVLRVVQDGANTFRNFRFKVSDYSEKADQVRATAVREAMRRATLFAGGANMKLGRLLALDPEADRNEGSAADLPSARGFRPLTNVYIPTEPGLEDVSATVSATWELVPQ